MPEFPVDTNPASGDNDLAPPRQPVPTKMAVEQRAAEALPIYPTSAAETGTA